MEVGMMKSEIATVACITVLAGLVVYFNPDFSKEVVISAISGLVGYLSKEPRATEKRGEDE